MKRLIALLLFALSIAGATAQNESQWGSLGLNAQGGIIRAWNNQYCIAYAEVGGTGHFFILDENGFVKSFPLHYSNGHSYKVKDFRVVDDNVVFCGCLGNQGLYGHFSAHDLLGQSGSCFPVDVVTVDEVTVYVGIEGSSSSTPIVLIGWKEIEHPIDETTSYIGYYGVVSKCTNWAGASIQIVSTDYHDLCFTPYEITKTDNYYAAVGWSGSGFGVLRMDIANPDVNTMAHYTINDVCSQVHCTAIDEDRIVVSALEINGNARTSIRVIKLPSLMMSNAQMFDLEEKAEPFGMTYIRDDHSVVLLQQMLVSGQTRGASVYINPDNNTSYITPLLYRGGYSPVSIDAFRNRYFVEAGGDQWFMKDKLAGMTAQCYTSKEINVRNIARVPAQVLGPVVFSIQGQNNYSMSLGLVESPSYSSYCITQ